MMRSLLLVLIVIFFGIDNQGQISEPGHSRKEPRKVKGQPFEGFNTTDRFEREITYYLSEGGAFEVSPPLVVFIPGSGCDSLFRLEGERIVTTGGFATFQDVFGRTARLMLVEKAGVRFLERSSGDCTRMSDFNRENTLERRAESIAAAIRDAIDLNRVNGSGVMLIGHSEGGIVAARLAATFPKTVSHVALLSAGGPSQLFDLISMARRGNFFSDVSIDPAKRVEFVLDEWKRILKDPESDTKFFFGFSFRRWSSYLRTSTLKELAGFNGRIYIGQGVEDQAVDHASADVLYADLVAARKDVVYSRVDGADHSFRLKDPKRDGWLEQANAIRAWYAPGT